MSARLNVLSAVCFISIAIFSAKARAQDAAAPATPPPVVDIDAAYRFVAVINTNSVNVRSGPGENYYATIKLDKGAQVTVVGMKFDWLKVLPPEGSYSWVAKAFVQKDPAGNTATLNGDNVRVRAGSSLVAVKNTVQCLLKKGEKVAIVGEEDEYYQIKPPTGAFLYIHQKFADPLKQINDKPIAVNPDGASTGRVAIVLVPADNSATPATPPSNIEQELAKAHANAAKVEAEFDRLEALLRSSADQNLDQQPIEEMIAGYQTILKSEHFSGNMRRVAEVRLIGLRTKTNAQQELLATRKQQQGLNTRLEGIRANREVVEQRLANGIVIYTAVGTLQASTLQVGEGTLYRLTDPATGRSIAYVRSSDPKFMSFLDKFAGVRGDLANDPQLSLKVVTATEIELVDIAKVHKGVSAAVIPPSITLQGAPKAQQATTDNN